MVVSEHDRRGQGALPCGDEFVYRYHFDDSDSFLRRDFTAGEFRISETGDVRLLVDMTHETSGSNVPIGDQNIHFRSDERIRRKNVDFYAGAARHVQNQNAIRN